MRRHSRLLAVCTAGIMAAGAFAFGPAAVAQADSGNTPHRAQVTGQPNGPRPTFKLPKQDKKAFSAKTAAAALTTPRFDADGDGIGDKLTQEADGTVYQSSSITNTWNEKGRGTNKYRDILTPGELIAGSDGPEVLSLTGDGHMSLWDNASFPTGAPVWTGSGWGIYNKVVTVGDVNGDGWADLAARTPTGDLYLYKGTGNPAAPFTGVSWLGSGFGIYDQLIGAGDITGTGSESLVARDLNGDLWYYKLDGNPLTARVKIGTGWNVYNQIIGLGNEEGFLGGLMGRTVSGDAYFYTGDGAGQLTPREYLGYNWNDELIAGQGSNPFWGKNHLFGLNAGGSLYYYEGNKTGVLGFRTPVGDAAEWKGAKLIAPTSLTNEGEAPLLELYQGTLYNDTYGHAGAIGSGWNIYNLVFGPGDVTGEGTSDLLARDAAGVLWSYKGTGTGTFGARVKIGSGWNAYNQIVGAGDITGDGWTDLVARTPDGTLYLYPGSRANGIPFAPRVKIGTGWNMYTKLAAPGDLDGDGRADIVGQTAAGALYRYSGTGHIGTTAFKPGVKIGASGWTFNSLF